MDFNLDCRFFHKIGFTLNIEERASLNASLIILKDSERFHRIKFWGKIFGIQKDYWIAEAMGEDAFSQRKFFYSMDGSKWVQVPEVSEEDVGLVQVIRGRFTGDPAFEYAYDKAGVDEEPTIVKEEKRLAATIHDIVTDVTVVPRGAYYMDAHMNVQPNPAFSGLDRSDLPQMESYFHFRLGYDINSKENVERDNFDETVDIFEPITKDEPKGVWSLTVENGGSVAMLRNFVWPGYLAFHTVNTNQFGDVYIGTGQKNVDIGFML